MEHDTRSTRGPSFGGLGEESQAAGNVEDLIRTSSVGPSSRIFDALEAVDPNDDKVDKMTYKRIVPHQENSESILERDNMGNAGLSA